MNDVKVLLKTMPWKHKGIIICLSVLSFILCWIAFDSVVLLVKGFLFSLILLVASYYDIRTRIIPDWIHILILIVGFIDFNLIRSITGLLLAPLPFLIMALIQEGSIGGGDVKLIGVSGFVLGVGDGLLMGIIGIIFAIIITLLYYFKCKSKSKLVFPFAPYLYLGWITMTIFLLFL